MTDDASTQREEPPPTGPGAEAGEANDDAREGEEAVDDGTAGDAGTRSSNRLSRTQREMVQRHFADTIEDTKSLSTHRRRYGDAHPDIEHVAAGIWLGGIFHLIDEARPKFVDTGQLTEKQFTRTFSVRKVARRVINASIAADANPRGSQGRSREPERPTYSIGAQLPFPTKYLSMPREKQLSMVRYARQARALETLEQKKTQKYDKELRDMNREIAELRTRVEDMGIAPLNSEEDAAHAIWNDIDDKRKEFRLRQEQLVEADEVQHSNDVYKLQVELEQLRRQVKDVFYMFDWTADPQLIGSARELKDVVPLTASQVPQTTKRKNYQDRAPEDLADPAGAAIRARNSVLTKLAKWASLYGGYSAPLYANIDGDDELRDIVTHMDEVSGKLDAYFKKKPLATRVCFAAFTPGPNPGTTVTVEGVLPDFYKTGLLTILSKLAGGGYTNVGAVDLVTKRADKKLRAERYK